MLGMKRAVALMLTAFLLLSALSVSTMASDKAAASGSSEAAYFDRLLETAPIDEAASDIGADKEVETVQEYEKGAGDGTGALFGCEAVAGDEADTIYESETGAGDETGALFGYGDGGESVGTDEEQDALAEIPAMAAAPEETGSEAEEENTAGEDYVDDLTGEMAGTAYDSGEMPGGGIPADELYGKEPKVEVIHAGLECGILAGKLEGLDCLSAGPDLENVHTVRERMKISSVENVWTFVLALLKEAAL